jgi:hypothetical protein
MRVWDAVLIGNPAINEIEGSIIIWKNALRDITNFIIFIVIAIKFCFNVIAFE